MCVSCLVYAGTNARKLEYLRRPCNPASSHVLVNLRVSQGLGHSIHVAKRAGFRDCFVCHNCGRYGQRQFRSLLMPCTGKASRNHIWKRVFCKQQHPLHKWQLDSVMPMKLPQVWSPDVFVMSVLQSALVKCGFETRTKGAAHGKHGNASILAGKSTGSCSAGIPGLQDLDLSQGSIQSEPD